MVPGILQCETARLRGLCTTREHDTKEHLVREEARSRENMPAPAVN